MISPITQAAFLSTPIQYDIHIHEKRRVVVIASIHYTLTEERNKRPIFVYVNLDRWALLCSSAFPSPPPPPPPPSGQQTFFPLSAATLINASALPPQRERERESGADQQNRSYFSSSLLAWRRRVRAIYPSYLYECEWYCTGFIVMLDGVAGWRITFMHPDHFKETGPLLRPPIWSRPPRGASITSWLSRTGLGMEKEPISLEKHTSK